MGSITASAPPRAAFPLEGHYRELFEGALLAIYVSRPDGRLLACNTAFAQMLGFDSIADAVATGIGAIHADEGERARFLARVKEHRRLEHFRGRLRRRDGEVIDVIETVIGQLDPAGELVELSGFLIDVTASVEAEANLVERARQFRSDFLDAGSAAALAFFFGCGAAARSRGAGAATASGCGAAGAGTAAGCGTAAG